MAVKPIGRDSDESWAAESPWRQVIELVDRAPTDEDLFHHRLGSIAARTRRARGLEPSAPLREEEQFAAAAALAARGVLDRVLATLDQPVLVFKGPEVACRYPDPTMRPHHDLDLIVEDAGAAHQALLAAGCEPVWERPSAHHELPLAFPDLPLIVELHHRPKAPRFARAPSALDLRRSAVPSTWDGRALTPPPAEHAVLLAAHAWEERPLRRVADLVDVHLLLAETTRGEADAVARRWGLGRVWRATLAAHDAVLGTATEPWTLLTWARNLPAVRGRSRAEELVERALAPFAALPPGRAAASGAAAFVSAMNPRTGRSVPDRLRRGPYEHPALSSRAPSRGSD